MKKMKKEKNFKIKLLKRQTFLKMLRNSCGSCLWRNNYGVINNKKVDLTENGNLSCAFFVSSILKIFNLISEIHLTVNSTEKDLINNGWQEINISKNMPQGTVLIWEKKRDYNPIKKRKEFHSHIGFYLGQEKAISMSSENGFPIIHHYTYEKKRKIAKAYIHNFLKK